MQTLKHKNSYTMKKCLKIFLMMSLLLVAACSKDYDDNVVVPATPMEFLP